MSVSIKEALNRLVRRMIDAYQKSGDPPKPFKPVGIICFGMTDTGPGVMMDVSTTSKDNLGHEQVAAMFAWMMANIEKYVYELEREKGYPYTKAVKALLAHFEKKIVESLKAEQAKNQAAEQAEAKAKAGQVQGEV